MSKTSDLIKKSHSKRGAPGTLKAKVKGKMTLAKARALKNKPGATTLDKKQANFFINMHSESTDWVCGQCNADPCVCESEINEEAMTAGDAGIPQDTKNMGPRGVIRNVLRRKIGTEIPLTDRRRKKNGPQVLLKKYRKYMR